jgi:hypothetical protein
LFRPREVHEASTAAKTICSLDSVTPLPLPDADPGHPADNVVPTLR